VSHIGICVSDWQRSLRFYQEGLGFRFSHELELKGEPSARLLRLRDVGFRAIYLDRDGVRIELLHYTYPGHVGGGSPREMNRLGLTHLSLEVEDLDSLLGGLESAGGRVLAETRIEVRGVKAVFLTDPDGTRIELVPSART
jgi:catechol 2,3-dioxygenase-like lactoylglutathione lyase family enzyme